MTTKILGKVGIGHKGLYSNTVFYKVKDEIRYGDPASTYRCINDSIGNEPLLNGDNEWWVLVTQHGEKGFQGEQGAQGDIGQQGAQGENPSTYHLSLDNKINKVLSSVSIVPSDSDDDQLLNALNSINTNDHTKSLAIAAAVQTVFYDNQLIDKLLPEPIVEDTPNYQSTWKPVPTNENYYTYVNENGLVLVDTSLCFSYPAGYPNYDTDWSSTHLQFIMANSVADSNQINARINELNIPLYNCGEWWSGSTSYPTTAIQVANLHPYSRLFYRMVNTIVKDGKTVQQPIKTFGANTAFRVKQVRHFKNIKYTDYNTLIKWGGSLK